MNRIVHRELCHGEKLTPCVERVSVTAKNLFQHPIHSFGLTISLWMVSRGHAQTRSE